MLSNAAQERVFLAVLDVMLRGLAHPLVTLTELVFKPLILVQF